MIPRITAGAAVKLPSFGKQPAVAVFSGGGEAGHHLRREQAGGVRLRVGVGAGAEISAGLSITPRIWVSVKLRVRVEVKVRFQYCCG